MKPNRACLVYLYWTLDHLEQSSKEKGTPCGMWNIWKIWTTWKIGRLGAAALGATAVFVLDRLSLVPRSGNSSATSTETPSSSIAQSSPVEPVPAAKAASAPLPPTRRVAPYLSSEPSEITSVLPSVPPSVLPSFDAVPRKSRPPLEFYAAGTVARLFTPPIPSAFQPPGPSIAVTNPIIPPTVPAMPPPPLENPFSNLVYSGNVQDDSGISALIEDASTHEGLWLTVGDTLRDYTITDLDPERIVFQSGGRVYTMPISSVINLVPLAQEASSAVLPDPGNLTAYRGKDGSSYRFQVTGATSGSVWGSGPYTDDSSLAVAAVHAGILRDGQTGTVRVTILPGYSSYEGSTQNGVTSNNYAEWQGSFRVSR